jgi:hypothetical protein
MVAIKYIKRFVIGQIVLGSVVSSCGKYKNNMANLQAFCHIFFECQTGTKTALGSINALSRVN